MAQDWEYNSVNLTTYAYNVQYLGAGADVPPRRGSNLTIPAKTGRYYTTNKKLDERRVTLDMWVKDVDPATGGSASETQLLANLDTLRKTFANDGTALLKWTMAGTVREAPAEVISAVPFEPFGTSPFYRLVVEFAMADPLWRSQTVYNSGTTTISTSPQNITLANNGTYRNEHGTITVVGQIVDPKFAVGAYYVQYTGTVAAGGTLTIDMSNWTATNGTVDVSGDITHDGDLVWLPVPVGTANTMTVTGTSISGSPTVTMSYLPRYI